MIHLNGNLEIPNDKLPTLPEVFYKADNYYAARQLFRIYGQFLVYLIVTPLLWSRFGILPLLIMAPFLGATVYKLTIILHECSHYTLLLSKRGNENLGALTAWILGTNFRNFVRSHWKHHRECGHQDDPLHTEYQQLEEKNWVKLALHLARPLFGLTFFETVNHYFFSNDEHNQLHIQNRPKIYDLLRQIIPILLIQAIIASITTALWRFPILIIYYPLVAASFGLFYSRIRSFCEHVPMERSNGKCFVRSHLPNHFDRFFFYDLNFNYHVEHHYYPQVPAVHLPKVHNIVSSLVHSEKTTSPWILRTIIERFRVAGKIHSE